MKTKKAAVPCFANKTMYYTITMTNIFFKLSAEPSRNYVLISTLYSIPIKTTY